MITLSCVPVLRLEIRQRHVLQRVCTCCDRNIAPAFMLGGDDEPLTRVAAAIGLEFCAACLTPLANLEEARAAAGRFLERYRPASTPAGGVEIEQCPPGASGLPWELS